MSGGTLRYTVILERGHSGWGAHVPDLPGCVAEAVEADLGGGRVHG